MNTARDLALAIRNARTGSEGAAYTMLSVWALMADRAAGELEEARDAAAHLASVPGVDANARMALQRNGGR